MKTIILSTHDIRAIVHRVGLHALMDEMIIRLTTAFKTYNTADTVVPARSGFTYTTPQVGLLEWMPIMQVGHQATIKVVGYHPNNPIIKNLPTIISTVSAYDTATGHLIGVADGTFLTALRTGATSAVASRAMASPASKVVGLIGAGAQAITQLHALTRIFEIETVFVYDINPEVTRSFLSRAQFTHLELVPVNQSALTTLVQSADILCTATSVEIGQGPVFEDVDNKPWLHINAVGSDFPGKYEVPLSLLKRSIVCPDFEEQAMKEGESQRLSAEEIGPSLVELMQNPEKYTYIQQQTSLFDSTGWALEDHVALEMMLEYAAELGLGTAIDLESITDDPRHPYQFVLNGEMSIRTKNGAVNVPVD